MTHPNLLHLSRCCAKWRNGTLLVATLFALACTVVPAVPSPLPLVARADTVRVGRVRCVFLTLRDSTHALGPEQPARCGQAFTRWVAKQK